MPKLLPTFRVITFDMRNHGASGEGPWEWPLVTADVEAVRIAYEVERPVVAGHSLGGMVAAIYAAAYPVCRAAINIDGQGRGKPSNYLDKTEEEVRAGWAGLEAQEAEFIAAMNRPRLAEMMDELNEIDLFEVWRAVPCPLQIFNCVGDDPQYEAMGFGELFTAYRNGLKRDFAALAAEIPTIDIATVDKTHISVIFEPDEAAEKMATFVTKYSSDRG